MAASFDAGSLREVPASVVLRLPPIYDSTIGGLLTIGPARLAPRRPAVLQLNGYSQERGHANR
jgi:hypothetical protein